MTDSSVQGSTETQEANTVAAEARDADAATAADATEGTDGEGAGQGQTSLLTSEEGQTDTKQDTETDGKAEDDADGEKTEAEGAPEAYEAFTVPEGMVYDEARAEAFSDIARKHNLSQAAAQEFVDMAGQMAADMLQKFEDEAIAERTGWAEEVRKSETFGGQDMDKKLEVARLVVKRFGDERLTKEVIDGKGVGNHVAFLGLLDKVGKALDQAGALREQDDRPVNAQGGAGGSQRDLRKLYPNTKAT